MSERDMYGDLAPWFQLLTPPEGYADEAAFTLDLLRSQVIVPLKILTLTRETLPPERITG